MLEASKSGGAEYAEAIAETHLASLWAGGHTPSEIFSKNSCEPTCLMVSGRGEWTGNPNCASWKCSFAYGEPRPFGAALEFSVDVYWDKAEVDIALQRCIAKPHGCRLLVSAKEALAHSKFPPPRSIAWMRWDREKYEFYWEVQDEAGRSVRVSAHKPQRRR